MYLKEFDIGLLITPCEEELSDIISKYSLSRLEATHYWYKNVGNWINRNFSLENRCVFSFYERIFKKINISDFWKVYIIVTSEKIEKSIICSGGVCSVYLTYDYQKFYNLNQSEKKIKSLELLMSGLKIVSDNYNVSYDYFKKFEQEIIDLNYENCWIWKKKHRGKKAAQLQVMHDIHNVSLEFSVFNSEKEKLKCFLIQIDKPDEWNYAKYLGNIKWITSEKVIWYDQNGLVIKEFDF